MANYEKQFSTRAVNTGGREGTSSLQDKSFEVNIVPPGSNQDGVNPEELFALGYSACFHSALDAVKGQAGVKNKSLVTQEVQLYQVPEKADFKLGVVIEVGFEDLDDDTARDLANQAHKVCPYSRAVENGHIDVEVKVVPYEEK